MEESRDNAQMGTREGRVEICINNAWGTVCGTLFGREDAAVVCGQLEGFQRDGWCLNNFLFIQNDFKCTLFNAGAVAVNGFSPGHGPIFLDQLDCSESDSSLLECRRFTPLELVTCEHTQDALVRCIGKAQTNLDCSIMIILVAFACRHQ